MDDARKQRPNGEGSDDPLFWELNQQFTNKLHEADDHDYRVQCRINTALQAARNVDGVEFAHATEPEHGGKSVAYFDAV